MGGLIKKMPFTFFAFLMSVIALAGMPPLSGFAGKWLLYTALLEKGWMFILVIAMLASTAAFLYAYKLLHTIFLGQLNEKYKDIKEVPMPIMLVQMFLAILTIIIGAKPEIVLNITEKVLLNSLRFTDPGYVHDGLHRIVSSVGYWNAWFMMIFTVGIFVIALIIFWLNNPKIKKVDQLDIAYSGEVPDTPESVHFGYALYMHFHRAVWFLVKPFIDKIYRSVYASILAIVDYSRKIYTGDTNTYALWVLISLSVILVVFVKGVF
jgi:NADH:ubiquinone oxidoreductase subunit 5 (subunit L)/multisubunit Na+/H+ antiporter MnhA subunit